MNGFERPLGSETSGYRRDALEAVYGEITSKTDTFSVSTEKYERMRTAKAEDAIGGARVLLKRCGNDDQTLLVSNRGETGWDIPGGAREPGETPEETARREVAEEVGLDVELVDVLQVFDWGFVPRSDDAERISGLWIHFEGVVPDDIGITVQEDELEAARWFDATPECVDPPAQPILREFFEADG